jgi:magnesium chelatase accessory protein
MDAPVASLPRDWPNRDASRFVRAAGMQWHVQTMGAGPVLLMAHGTGAATHSWRALAPLLAEHFSIVAPDLPGHGFSPAPPKARLTLPFMARAVADLCNAMAVRPAIVVGHSAGAAILARACLDGMMDPRALVSLNGALLPMFGLPGKIFSPLAKLIVGLPGLANMFLRHTGNRAVVEKLLRETGSTIDAAGVDLYARLAANPAHAGAALNMMASWDLPPLVRDLPRLKPKLLLIVGDNDRSIAPADSEKVRGMVPGATLVRLPRLGHLAHEEAPDATAALVTEFARTTGVLTP